MFLQCCYASNRGSDFILNGQVYLVFPGSNPGKLKCLLVSMLLTCGTSFLNARGWLKLLAHLNLDLIYYFLLWLSNNQIENIFLIFYLLVLYFIVLQFKHLHFLNVLMSYFNGFPCLCKAQQLPYVWMVQ